MTCTPSAGNVALWRRPSPVPPRSAEDASSYTLALLRVQGDLGLDNIVFDLLYGYHGTVQRRIQEQDQRGKY